MSFSWTELCHHHASAWEPWWLSSVSMTSKGDSRVNDNFFVGCQSHASQSDLVLVDGLICRNFDEVLSSFAEPLLESASFSDSCSGLYNEENFKVSTVILSAFFSQMSDVTSIAEASHYLISHHQQNKRENPIHIINVSIKTADTEDDDALVTALTAFAQSKVSRLIQFLCFSNYCGDLAEFHQYVSCSDFSN